MTTIKIIQTGEANGNHMIVRLTFPSQPVVYGLATKNFYGGRWDTGPTWNYLVMADRPFLVDTGRPGATKALLEMIEATGLRPDDLAYVLLTHGHEDHDGGMSEIAGRTGAKVLAHPVYQRLIRFYPDDAPAGVNPTFPPSCWHCVMPESFTSDHCLTYHQDRTRLSIGNIGEAPALIDPGLKVFHLPGHHPDAVAITLGTAAILVGDNLLPEITPMPSRTHFFHQVGGVLASGFPDAAQSFGLQAYLRTLKSLVRLGNTHPQFTVLPGHRLFTDGRWNEIDLAVRAVETLTHHRQRCAVILDSLGPNPQTAETTARRHFTADALEGLGIYMAVNEIESHLEFLAECGDVVRVEADRWQWAGGYGYESAFDDLKAF